MGFLGTFLGIVGFGFGVPIGILLGHFLYIYFLPTDVEPEEVYKTALVEKYGLEIKLQPSFDATIWVEATGDVSKNKVYGFGLQAHSSSVLARTPTSCSTSQLDGSSGSASTINSATQGTMENM